VLDSGSSRSAGSTRHPQHDRLIVLLSVKAGPEGDHQVCQSAVPGLRAARRRDKRRRPRRLGGAALV